MMQRERRRARNWRMLQMLAKATQIEKDLAEQGLTRGQIDKRLRQDGLTRGAIAKRFKMSRRHLYWVREQFRNEHKSAA